ncbi:MAG: hypothetical protein Q8M94_19405 [Ignavibacteria bacterium]|nr:hypothetical protein [Ignavibacteria bacterium]
MKKNIFILFLNSLLNLNFFSLISLITFLILTSSCSSPTEPPPDDKKTTWEVIPELADMDVRYILKFNNTLFLSGLFTGREYRGAIWKTTDGENWTMLRTFEKAVGPLATNGDTLYCLGDSLFRYIIPLKVWENVCQPYPLNTDVQAVSEMIFFGNTLYAFENYFATAGVYKIDFSGNVENLAPFYMYTKFAKMIKKNVNDMWCYARGRYHSGGFFIFTLEGFSVLSDGLTQQVLLNPPSNSMEIRNDTLFAGFRYPGIIKYLDEANVWRDYSDSIPTTRLDATSPYVEPTEISCMGDRMFVSTDIFGVMEWKKGIGWIDMAEGLRTYDWSNGKVFYPIVFLENINNTLIAASGAPGYAAWGGNGVYKLKQLNVL